MKSYTYASLATVVFLKHHQALSKSIESAIRSTDRLAESLGYTVTLSHMTKYRIITNLIKDDILAVKGTTGRKKIRVSDAILTYLHEET